MKISVILQINNLVTFLSSNRNREFKIVKSIKKKKTLKDLIKREKNNDSTLELS